MATCEKCKVNEAEEGKTVCAGCEAGAGAEATPAPEGEKPQA